MEETEYFYNESGLSTRYLFTKEKTSIGAEFKYDSEGKLTEQIRFLKSDYDTSAMKNISIYNYDAVGKLSEVRHGIFGRPLTDYYRLNYSGNLPVSITYYYNTDSVPQFTHSISIIYDERERIISMEGKDTLSSMKIKYEGEGVIYNLLGKLEIRYVIKENRLTSINTTVFTSFIREYFYNDSGLIEYEIYTQTKTGEQEKTIFEYEFYEK
jgi:hypothetical protein